MTILMAYQRLWNWFESQIFWSYRFEPSIYISWSSSHEFFFDLNFPSYFLAKTKEPYPFSKRSIIPERARLLLRPWETKTIQFRPGETKRQHRLPAQTEPGLPSRRQSRVPFPREHGRLSRGETGKAALQLRIREEGGALQWRTTARLEETERHAQSEISFRAWEEDVRGRGGVVAVGPLRGDIGRRLVTMVCRRRKRQCSSNSMSLSFIVRRSISITQQ